MTKEVYAWEEKYRPQTVGAVILPEALKSKFQGYVNSREVPNLLLAGPPGVGKTVVAKAMLHELGCDCIIKNASLEGNIDTLRNDITQFAQTVSLMGGRKYVILDEADYLNSQSFQPGLRAFMVDFKENCGFILTCNWKSRIIEPLHSRLAVIDFREYLTAKGRDKLMFQFHSVVMGILEKENVRGDPAVVAKVIQRYYPDFRKVLVELQAYVSTNNEIDVGMLAVSRNETLDALITAMKVKSYGRVRQWIGENVDNAIFRNLYDVADQYMQPHYVPQLVLTTARYQHMATQCVDDEVNIAGYLTEVMAEAEWK